MKEIFNYLEKQSITEPYIVDSFLISAFIDTNKISVLNNKFILEHLINKNNQLYLSYISFLEVIQSSIDAFTLENLIQLFEFIISPSDRIVSGAIYTPEYIRKYIVEAVTHKKQVKETTFADISCGCGGFLLTVTNLLRNKKGFSFKSIYEEYIYGIDIQDYSIKRSKILLTLNALLHGEDEVEYDFNLYVRDALLFDWSEAITNYIGFDFIVGNPPYVCAKNLDDNSKANILNWSVATSGNTDLYIPFFQIAINNLKKNGLMGFITMNSFFKSLNARQLREYFKELSLRFQVIDFGYEQIFKSKNTYTCICIVKNIHSDHISYQSTTKNELTKLQNIVFDKVLYENLDSKKGWNLKNHELISKIENVGRPFCDIYKTRHGIATLKNNVFIFRPYKVDDAYFYFIDCDSSQQKVEKSICREIFNTNKLSSKQESSNLVEKIIFPYFQNNNGVHIISENEMKSEYPCTYKYLLTKKEILSKRDKGKQNYPAWYAFGRTQSLEDMRYKLFFPKYSNKTPFFILNKDKSAKFYNGLAIIGSTLEDLFLIQKIMESRLFWFYIESTSKPYASGYYSLNGNYIKNFGIFNFSLEEKQYILSENDENKLNTFFEEKYDVKID